ncbi:sulfotransferase [bacterium]|nr:sulfotransferase [bacterium]
MLQIQDMSEKLVFIVGSPRSGSTLLERMISSHSRIVGGPEPHLMTPLAHLGYYENVNKAPYDHLRAVAAQREFVNILPNKEQDYLTALQAYCFHLYGQQLLAAEKGKQMVLDKTPAYALVLPFISKVFPRAKYIVLTRHPAAIFSSYAQSFFENDWKAAHSFNPLIERYVPAISRFIRKANVPMVHIRYEDLVQDPELHMRRVCDCLELPFEENMVEYGRKKQPQRKGLGDPIGVSQHQRPVTSSIHKWVKPVLDDPEKEKLLRKMIGFNDPEDYKTLGYDPNKLLEPLEGQVTKKSKKNRKKADAFTWERRILHKLRRNIHQNALGRLLKKIRFLCEVLLR